MFWPDVETEINKAPVNIRISPRTVVTTTFEIKLSSVPSHIEMDCVAFQEIHSKISSNSPDLLPNLVESAVKGALKRWPDNEALRLWWRDTGYQQFQRIDAIVATNRFESIEHVLTDFVNYWKSHLEVTQYESCNGFLFWAMEYMDHCRMMIDAGSESFSNRVDSSTINGMATWKVDGNL